MILLGFQERKPTCIYRTAKDEKGQDDILDFSDARCKNT